MGACAYLAALCTSIAAIMLLPDAHPLIVLLIADIAATLVVYLFARLLGNASLYDPYWSLAPVAIVLYWLLAPSAVFAEAARQGIVAALVLIWALRLTWNWARGWKGLRQEDWRYRDLRMRSGARFWLVELVGIEMMPTVLVFLGCLPLYPALAVGEGEFSVVDGLAAFVTAVAIMLEATADAQLRKFKGESNSSGATMAQGLWAYSRHPNYLGEILFWWGLYLFALAADPSFWWTVVGPLSITVLFLTVSIPLMEKRNMATRPGYAEYKERTPMLLPWFPKR